MTIVDDILNAMNRLNLHPLPRLGYPGIRPFDLPFRILEAPSVPVIQLSTDVPVSDAFRRQFNAWALDRFGTRSVVPKGQVYLMPYLGAMIVRPEQMAVIRNLGVA